MKKYSSYTNLKLAGIQKQPQNEYYPKVANIQNPRRIIDIPLMIISK